MMVMMVMRMTTISMFMLAMIKKMMIRIRKMMTMIMMTKMSMMMMMTIPGKTQRITADPTQLRQPHLGSITIGELAATITPFFSAAS